MRVMDGSAVKERKADYRVAVFSISLLVILLDRISKRMVSVHLPEGEAYPVIPHVFRISDVHNTGAAFSLFAGSASQAVTRWALVGFSAVAAVVIFAMLWRMAKTITLTSVALAMILGGAIGNLYDRVRYHFVIDFLEVHIFNYHWPDFNVADSCIVIGACLLLIEILWPRSEAE